MASCLCPGGPVSGVFVKEMKHMLRWCNNVKVQIKCCGRLEDIELQWRRDEAKHSRYSGDGMMRRYKLRTRRLVHLEALGTVTSEEDLDIHVTGKQEAAIDNTYGARRMRLGNVMPVIMKLAGCGLPMGGGYLL